MQAKGVKMMMKTATRKMMMMVKTKTTKTMTTTTMTTTIMTEMTTLSRILMAWT
jgi:hypothetical protein